MLNYFLCKILSCCADNCNGSCYLEYWQLVLVTLQPSPWRAKNLLLHAANKVWLTGSFGFSLSSHIYPLTDVVLLRMTKQIVFAKFELYSLRWWLHLMSKPYSKCIKYDCLIQWSLIHIRIYSATLIFSLITFSRFYFSNKLWWLIWVRLVHRRATLLNTNIQQIENFDFLWYSSFMKPVYVNQTLYCLSLRKNFLPTPQSYYNFFTS